MRIGIEVLGTQSCSRLRGIGRYVHEFVSALTRLESRHEYVIYGQKHAPTDYLPDVPKQVPFRFLEPNARLGERDLTAAFRRLLAANPDRLDAILITNPLELRDDFLTPARPLNDIKIGAIVHDLIPLIFRDHYYSAWPGPEFARRYHRGLDRLKTYDFFLTNSDATRDDTARLLGVSPRRITTILAASDAPTWHPVGPENERSDARVLASLGIEGGFVFSLGSIEYRKNIWGLIDAFARLPERERDVRRLVLTYAMSPAEESAVMAHAAKSGVDRHVLITPRLKDTELATLYRRCDAFVFPSKYEGFGFPVLEALHCGAPVITGKNSSLVEVVGNAGLLIDCGDTNALRDSMENLLLDREEAERLRSLGPIQASGFSWRNTSLRAIEAFDRLATGTRRVRVDVPNAAPRGRKRIAYFSPFPPLLSGISDYSDRLVEELRGDYIVDLYHDAGYEPSVKVRGFQHACHDYRLFRRNDSILHYDAIIYQMGNSGHHRFIHELMADYPGIVTLHDFNLAGFRYWDAIHHSGGIEAFRRELFEFDPTLAAKLEPTILRHRDDPKIVIETCTKAGAFVNHAVFQHATHVVVHSPWCERRAREIHGDLANKTRVVNYGATVLPRSESERRELRLKYGLDPESFIVGNFGIIHETKMNVESLRAFADTARERADAVFILVGPEYDGGASRREVAKLGLENRVRFLGPRPASEFVELTATADIGLNLRRPPSNGETSSSLIDLLRQGIATIITDVGTFDDFPDEAVSKVRWTGEGFEGLRRRLLELSRDDRRRRELGRAGAAYIERRHAWTNAAKAYAELIEQASRNLGEPNATPAPHFLTSTLNARTRKETSR